jgi:hypothetical protein
MHGIGKSMAIGAPALASFCLRARPRLDSWRRATPAKRLRQAPTLPSLGF